MKKLGLKIVASALSVGLMAMPLAACGNQQGANSSEASSSAASSSSTIDTSTLKTMGDVLSLEQTSNEKAFNKTTYLYVVNNRSAPIRAIAKITKEIYAELNRLDADSNHEKVDYGARLKEILGDVALTQVDNLAAGIPAQEELNKLVGKTGQDLLDDGYTYVRFMGWGDGCDTEVLFEKGDYSYLVTFPEQFSSDINGDEKLIKNLPVKAVQYDDLSEAAMDPNNF